MNFYILQNQSITDILPRENGFAFSLRLSVLKWSLHWVFVRFLVIGENECWLGVNLFHVFFSDTKEMLMSINFLHLFGDDIVDKWDLKCHRVKEGTWHASKSDKNVRDDFLMSDLKTFKIKALEMTLRTGRDGAGRLCVLGLIV